MEQRAVGVGWSCVKDAEQMYLATWGRSLGLIFLAVKELSGF